MADANSTLIEFYERELSFFRKMGAAYARRYPKIAARLELSEEECPDPHVERLIESFAFLAGRIHHNIEAEFPQFTNALLGVLYPQFCDPIPSMTVAEFKVDPLRGKITTGFPVPKGSTLFTESGEGATVRFRTAYPVHLWPIELVDAKVEPISDVPRLEQVVPRAAGVLRLRLRSQGGPMTDLEFSRLRFYLYGERREVYGLYDTLFSNVIGITVQPDSWDTPRLLRNAEIKQVGFQPEEELLPYPAHAHIGYRLLQEYFLFPQKFLFVDLDGISHSGAEEELEILLALNTFPKALQAVNKENFKLHCTPIINLFKKVSEPIRMDHRKAEYRLVPDARREPSTEIHSIRKVSGSAVEENTTSEYAPYFSYTHTMRMDAQKAFWAGRRVEAVRPDVEGTDMMLSFVNLAGEHVALRERTVFAHLWCTNRGLAERLPASGFLDIESSAPLENVTVVHKPTAQVQPPLAGEGLWKLISHLSVNHLSLTGGAESLYALQEMLRLHAMSDDPFVHQQINGITGMTTRTVARRVGDVAWAYSRGTEVLLTFDAEAYNRNSFMLLSSVLNRFFALYATINSFTELAVKLEQREDVVKRWPPMIGEQPAL